MQDFDTDMEGFLVSILLLLLLSIDNPQQTQMHKTAMEFRKSRGLAEQTLDPELCKIAQDHANWMAGGGGLNHGPNDQIIAYNTNGSLDGSIVQCMNQWTGSPPHAAWLYGRSERVGWGYAVSGSRRYFAGVFRGSTGTSYTPYYPIKKRRRIFRRRRR